MRRILALGALFLFLQPAFAAPPEKDIGEVKGQAIRLFVNRDYEHLNKLFKQYRVSGEKTPGGLSKLSLLYAGIAEIPLMPTQASPEEWRAVFLGTQEWVSKRPSPAAYIAQAEANTRYAWGKYGADGTSSPERQKEFATHIDIAYRQLVTSKAVASVDPEWQVAMDSVTRAQKQASPQSAVASVQTSPPLVMEKVVSYLANDDINVVARIKIQARLLFDQKKFKQLNDLAERYRTSLERTPAGESKLELIYRGLLDDAGYQTPSLVNTPNVNRWNAIFQSAQDWEKKNSPTAIIALAKLHRQLAWLWRGNGTVDTMRDDAWEPFHTQMAAAYDLLQAHKADAIVDPEWFVTMIDLEREDAGPDEDADASFAEAIKKYKHYDRIYEARVIGLMPMWGGSWDQVEEFANFAAENTKDKDGDVLYTRVYLAVADCGCRIFNETKVNWDRMKSGFRDIVKRYPDEWNLNTFAYYACQAGDRQTAKEIFSRISRPYMAAWDDDQAAYDQCKAGTEGA